MALSPTTQPHEPEVHHPPPLYVVLREWGRIGCTGFGGPPTHIALLRDLCVSQQGWIEAMDFEDAIAACNLMPGPASTQLSIYCAWRVRGRPGALVGGLAFILPGLVAIICLAAIFLAGSPPALVRGAAAGAGGAVAAVAVNAGLALLIPSWKRARLYSPIRWTIYLAAGAAAAATLGPWLVLVLLGCGLVELTLQGRLPRLSKRMAAFGLPLTVANAGGASGGLLPLAWVAFKVGALSYGGGFVIIPLMQSDAVSHYHWMTNGEFLSAVALGQVTPGPVTLTVAAVGFAQGGVGAALLAAAMAFAPSFAFVLAGGQAFDRIRRRPAPRAFLDGAGPAAIGAIFGAAITLAEALSEPWQVAVLAGAAGLLFLAHRGVVFTFLAAALIGAIAVLLGAPLSA